MPNTYPQLLEALASREPVSPGVVRGAFDAMLEGKWTPAQVAGVLVALRMRPWEPDVLAEACEAMRAAMRPFEHQEPAIIDTCGTGGDGKGTLNISTASAIVVASCGVRVAKHGNRSVSSKAGSADVLEALGVPLEPDDVRQQRALRDAGIVFLYAPAHHPAMKHVGPIRRELGVRTIFNVLGPLANPARPSHQLLGTFDDALRPVMAAALARLGTRRAWVVRSEDGLDEVSPEAKTRVTSLEEGGRLVERTVGPEDFGVAPVPLSTMTGGDAQENARALEAILAGEAHPASTAIVVNAGAAISLVTGETLREGAERARDALASGRAKRALDTWKRAVGP